MAKPRDDGQKDLLRPALEAIIDMAGDRYYQFFCGELSFRVLIRRGPRRGGDQAAAA
jgi:hypothetical protein